MNKIKNLEVYTPNNVMPQYMERLVKGIKKALHRIHIDNDVYCFTACKPVFNKHKYKRDVLRHLEANKSAVRAELTKNKVSQHKIEEICGHIESFKSILV